MKKFLALGSAALLLICGGCQEESIVNEPVSAQPVSVRFALTLREDIEPFLRTRNLPGGLPGEPSAANASPDEEETPSTQPVSTLSYIEYAVYDNDTEELIEHRRYEVDGQDGSLQVQDELTAGIYKVCFLAHGVTDATFAEENSLVTFPEVEDTFWGFQEIEVDATQTDQSFSVGLGRAVAGIELVPTDAVPEQVDQFLIETSGRYHQICLLDGKTPAVTEAFSLTVAFEAEDKLPDTRVKHFFYSFVPEAAPEAASAFLDAMILTSQSGSGEVQRQRTITQVPLYRNRITRYTGTLYTPSIVDGLFDLQIDTNWGEYVDQVLE